MNIFNERVKLLQDVIRINYRFEVSEALIKRVMLAEPGLRADISAMGIDTSNREWFLNGLCGLMGMNNWPTNADEKEYQNLFFAEFKSRAAEVLGLTLPTNFEEIYTSKEIQSTVEPTKEPI